MKLYTEEQVRAMLEVCIDSDLYEHILTFEDILKTQIPIALPSDEEISEESMDLYGKLSASITDVLQYKAFKRGAKWVLNKIQGEDNS
jgi:hypothetical protein